MGVQVYGLFVKKEFRALNSTKYHTIFKDPGTKHSGVFYFKRKGKMSIDYKKLNDQIVKQAYDHTSAFLSEDQKQKLFQNKIDRAVAMIESRKAFEKSNTEYIQLED
jgi:flagellar capping protein FliD